MNVDADVDVCIKCWWIEYAALDNLIQSIKSPRLADVGGWLTSEARLLCAVDQLARLINWAIFLVQYVNIYQLINWAAIDKWQMTYG